ncbi:MAG: CapA family protein [bacterium]|jgi:poly-gamma-glutamate synthesis protein (capsule biosynthesis protein)|nr:CapA family protein [Betaproteobacteria bacterium]
MGSNDDAVVTLAAGGDVKTGHDPLESAFTHILEPLRSAHIRFAQVERLYSDRGTFQFQSLAEKLEVRQPPQNAAAFKAVPFDVLSLASNHVGDWGPEAIEDTVDVFRDLGLPTIGAGHTITQAREPVFLERNGLRVAFLGYCSVLLPQYWATDTRAGCAPMRAHTFYEPYEYQPGSPARVITVPHAGDLECLVDDVRKARRAADQVVVSLHWGLHYVAYPTKYQTVVAHAAIDAGACAIVGHHPHQPQGVEVYRGGIIFYSLGNLAVHPRGGGYAYCQPGGEYTHNEVFSVEPEPGVAFGYKRHWNEGGLAFLDIDRTGVRRATFLPTLMNARGQPEVLAAGTEAFEKLRVYLEWCARNIAGGINQISVEEGRYLLHRRSA